MQLSQYLDLWKLTVPTRQAGDGWWLACLPEVLITVRQPATSGQNSKTSCTLRSLHCHQWTKQQNILHSKQPSHCPKNILNLSNKQLTHCLKNNLCLDSTHLPHCARYKYNIQTYTVQYIYDICVQKPDISTTLHPLQPRQGRFLCGDVDYFWPESWTCLLANNPNIYYSSARTDRNLTSKHSWASLNENLAAEER